jgi:hypothetical protein
MAARESLGMPHVHLHCNASTPIDLAVAAAMRPFLAEAMPNASFIAVLSKI